MFEILLVEDEPAGVFLVEHALHQFANPCLLRTAADGEAALKVLLGREVQIRPDLILLDINLPRINGLELLQRIKADERTRRIPVIVMSSSQTEKDIDAAYRAGANGYVQKPQTWDKLLQVFGAIESFWLELAELPPR
jgi:two-component system, chemotaxis family, response regulator Rcp1